VITGLPAPGRAVVEVAPVVSVLLVSSLVVAALDVELVVVVVRVVVVLVLTDVVRELPQATQTSAVRTTAARRAVVAEPGKRIERR
jgi:hypothetical protein